MPIKNALFLLFFLVPILFAFVMTGQTVPYFGFDIRHGFLGTKSFKTVSTPLFQWSFYIHIGSSLLVWVLGIVQLVPFFIRNRSFHRISGKGYIFLILFLAAPTGLGLSLFANGGLSAKVGFFLQSCVWWVVTLKAFVEIKNGNLRSHVRWMLRSLAITYAAFSLRTESFLMMNFFGTKPIETYLSVVWLSWVGNLLLMEVLLMYKLDVFLLHFGQKRPYMKNLLLFLILFAIGAACKNVNSGKNNLQTHKEAVDTLRLANATDTLVRFTYLKNPVIMDSIDLSDLMIYKDDLGGYANNFNGFFGADNYRIEIYWDNAYKDPSDSKLYHVSGKTRFKKNVAKFTGEIRVDSVFQFVDPRIDLTEFGYEETDKKSLKTYEARGTLTMKEDSAKSYAGQFSGNFYLDFSHAASGMTDMWYFSPDTPANGGGFVSSGFWSLYNSSVQKPYVFGKDFFMFANGILKDFSYGERDVEINEKYLHLGWDEWWENDEWWVEEKKAM